MKSLSWSLCVVLLLAGCAGTEPRPVASPAAPATGAFTGEVWTWDGKAGTITLRQGAQTIRVKAAPDQFVGLRMHETRTVRGELAPPAEIERVVLPPGSLVPRGPAEETELTGTVMGVDPAGIVTITTDRRLVRVWLAQPGSTTFKDGDSVRLKIRIQPMEVVPAKPGDARPTVPELAASPTSEPGDYAVITGRILSIESGRLNVESPRGPITVWMPTIERYKAGEHVEVRTSVHPAQ